MRNIFAKTVTELSDVYPELVMLAGDIGNRLFDRFKVPNVSLGGCLRMIVKSSGLATSVAS